MQLSAKLLFGILVASPATGVLANDNSGWDYGTCHDGSPRKSATAASQAGPLPYCSDYISTSVITVTKITTATFANVVTKTKVSEIEVGTTIVVTKTTTGKPQTVTSTIPVTVTSEATFTTITTLPAVTVTSTMLLKRDHNPPMPTSTKCSCIVLFSTHTISSTKTQTTFSTVVTTILSTETEKKTILTTSTVTPISTTLVLATTTLVSTTTTTQTQASTTTTVRDVPSACANLAASPVSSAANTISHPEGNYESIYSGQGMVMPDIVSCCTACYELPGCFSFNYANFNPESEPPQLGSDFCQVFVGINAGAPISATCPSPGRVQFVAFTGSGAGPNDFFYGGAGPCSSGIDIASIQ